MTAIYDNRDAAETAYNALLAHGFSKDDVNIVMTDETRKQHFDHRDADESALTDKAMEGAGKGSAIGGTVGAVAAAIAAIGTTLALPGLGLLIAGPLAAGLAGAGAGGLAGGLIGALVNSGIPEETAKAYESGLKSGGIVVGVHPRNEADEQYLTQQGFH
ncbi:hypothetical protein GCM10027190_31730 [Spirosoma areae]